MSTEHTPEGPGSGVGAGGQGGSEEGRALTIKGSQLGWGSDGGRDHSGLLCKTVGLSGLSSWPSPPFTFLCPLGLKCRQDQFGAGRWDGEERREEEQETTRSQLPHGHAANND